MKPRPVFVASVLAFLLVGCVVLAYVFTFGTQLLDARDAWGQFGDYFAGMLNPLFAMLAFLAVLYSIGLQRDESHRATERFESQLVIAKAELAGYSNERTTLELLAVVRDIDERLSTLLKAVVSPPNTHPAITLSLMVSEAERLRTGGGESKSYEQFVALAKERGSVVEALVREMASLVEEMRKILAQFSNFRGTSQAPLIVYYANKVMRLLSPLEDSGFLPPYTRASFAAVGDKHHGVPGSDA